MNARFKIFSRQVPLLKTPMIISGLLLTLTASFFWGPTVIIRGPVAAISTRSFRHHDTLYIPVASLARAYGLTLQRAEGPYFVFASEGCRLELRVGSRAAVINGKAVRMIAPTDWVKGKLAVPIYLAIQTLSEGFPPPEEFPRPREEKTIRIMIDPGHGGIDPGAVGRGGVMEKEVVLEIARQVKSLLELRGCEVIMTRSGDRFVSLKKRARRANMNKVDIFVSIHANAATNHLAQGAETFYYAPASDLQAKKLALVENVVLSLEAKAGEGKKGKNHGGDKDNGYSGRLVQSIQLAGKVQKRMEAVTRGPDRGTKSAEFYVIKYTEMPSILVETGFLSNHNERDLLTDIRYRQKMAEAIAEGIWDYLQI